MVSVNGLCRCICGTSGKKKHNTLSQLDLGNFDEVDEPTLTQPPAVTGRLSYMVSAEQPLRGEPIREGVLWYFSPEESVEPVEFSLYVNGFSFRCGGQEASVSLSPFALVRNCKFQSCYSDEALLDMKIFKVSVFSKGNCYYYGVKGKEEKLAEEERSRWVLDISRVIRLVTQSLFPPYRISCDPLKAVASTQRRLMAGYLLHHDNDDVASVLYCELHPQCEDQAKLVLYENELCEVPVVDIYLSEASLCCEKVGINCSCFFIEEHHFSTRTLCERKLWLRAISNVKVKLQNRAPAPSSEDLKDYRLAIKEHLGSIKASLDVDTSSDALLQRTWRCKEPHASNSAPSVTDAVKTVAASSSAFSPPQVPCPHPPHTNSQDSAGEFAGDLGAIELLIKPTPRGEPEAGEPVTPPSALNHSHRSPSPKGPALVPSGGDRGAHAPFGQVLLSPQVPPQPGNG